MTKLPQIAAYISAMTIIAGTAVWAADTRYVTIDAQKHQELRQLKRDIKRLELKEDNGSASAEDRAFAEFLRQEAESLMNE